MPAFALDLNLQAGRRGNRFHHADLKLFFFEQWTLLDMQFDESGIVTGRQRHLRERTRKSRGLANLAERLPFFVDQRFVRRSIQHACHQTAS